MTRQEAMGYNGQVLAFIGDAVHTLYIREKVLTLHSAIGGDLHKMAVCEMSAVAQSKHIMDIMDNLTEEELDIYKRGRNTKVHTIAKNASVAEYKRATGYEALIGYLYLVGENDRIRELINMLPQIGEQKEN